MLDESGGGSCFVKSYGPFTHICDVKNYLPSVGHCCCELISKEMALCCRYRQAVGKFRCERDDAIDVRSANLEYLSTLLTKVALIGNIRSIQYG